MLNSCPKPVRKANGLDDEDNNCVRNLFAANSSQKSVNQCSDESICTAGRVTPAYSCNQINLENSCDMQYYFPQENPVQSHTVVPEHPQEDVPSQFPTGNDNLKNLEPQSKILDDSNRSKSAPQLDSTGGYPSTAVQNMMQEPSLKETSNQFQMQSSMNPCTKFGELPLNQSPIYNGTGHNLQNQSIPNQYSRNIPPEMGMHSSYYSPTLSPQTQKLTSHIHIHEPSLPAGINNCPHHGTYAKGMYQPNPLKQQQMHHQAGIQNIPELQQWQFSQENIIPDMNNNGTFPGFFNNCPAGRNHYVLACSKDLQILDADSTHICNGNKI